MERLERGELCEVKPRPIALGPKSALDLLHLGQEPVDLRLGASNGEQLIRRFLKRFNRQRQAPGTLHTSGKQRFRDASVGRQCFKAGQLVQAKGEHLKEQLAGDAVQRIPQSGWHQAISAFGANRQFALRPAAADALDAEGIVGRAKPQLASVPTPVGWVAGGVGALVEPEQHRSNEREDGDLSRFVPTVEDVQARVQAPVETSELAKSRNPQPLNLQRLPPPEGDRALPPAHESPAPSPAESTPRQRAARARAGKVPPPPP